MQEKTYLRGVMRAKLTEQSALERAHCSAQICTRLKAWSAARRDRLKRVAIFLAGPREPNLDEYGRYLQSLDIDVYAPCMTQCQAPFSLLAPDWGNVRVNAGNWREPQPGSVGESLAASEMDAIFLPGLAFDLKGNRLGQGGGWYDRALEGLPAHVLCIGVAFDFQIGEELPREPHDQTVSILCTEQRILHVRTNDRT